MSSLYAFHLNLWLIDPLYYLSTLCSQWRKCHLRAIALRYCVFDEYVKTYCYKYNFVPNQSLIDYHNVYK